MSGDGSAAEPAAGADGGASAARRRFPWAAPALVLVVQIVLMLGAFLPTPHTGGDNAGYLELAYSLLHGSYRDLYLPGQPLHTKYPPGFPLLLAGARLLGAATWVQFKVVVAGSTTLMVLFAFLWARERRGPVFAALLAGLLALSSAVVYYSHWILSDLPFLALTLVALWALERADRGGAGSRTGSSGWLVLGCGAAISAYFTRSAGLPLIVAVAGWLGLRRRWKSLGSFLVAFGVPALLWWLRGRGETTGYGSEFLLVNPYRPELGRAGPLEMVERLGRNLWGYTTHHVPSGITGLEGISAAVLGIALAVLALWGWTDRLRRGSEAIGVAELFFPLYAGLILLWPEVWSGDRFALPLFPLVLLYGGVAALELGSRVHARARRPAAAAGLLLLAIPAAVSWMGSARDASACLGAARGAGPWACAGAPMAEFAAAAGWSGRNLPEGSVVIARKPRFFFLLSGLRSQMFPLSRDPEEFFRQADRDEAGYVLLDRLDGLAGYYVVPVIRARPGAFCPVNGFGAGGGSGTELFGVLPAPRQGKDGGGRLAPCPSGTIRAEPIPAPTYSESTIPLFARSSS